MQAIPPGGRGTRIRQKRRRKRARRPNQRLNGIALSEIAAKPSSSTDERGGPRSRSTQPVATARTTTWGGTMRKSSHHQRQADERLAVGDGIVRVMDDEQQEEADQQDEEENPQPAIGQHPVDLAAKPDHGAPS